MIEAGDDPMIQQLIDEDGLSELQAKFATDIVRKN